MNDLSKCILLFTACWDFVCAVAMMVSIFSNHVNVLTWARVSLWVDVEPSDAGAMMLMYAVWVANFSVMGFVAYSTEDMLLAGWCYVLEIAMVFIGITREWIDPARGWTTLTFGVVYLVILLM